MENLSFFVLRPDICIRRQDTRVQSAEGMMYGGVVKLLLPPPAYQGRADVMVSTYVSVRMCGKSGRSSYLEECSEGLDLLVDSSCPAPTHTTPPSPHVHEPPSGHC